MADRPARVADPLAWWQDKQVAIVVGTSVVRGWVLTASSHELPADASGAIGQLTVVLFIGSATLAQKYPSEVTVTVHPGGPHGRPHRVLGLWSQDDLTDVRPHHGATQGAREKPHAPGLART